MNREQMNIVIVGHVDHGKSTVIGRLLADTGSLPQGKLQEVKDNCKKNSKPFEYAFLLDALKDEQSQGITIDTARCFFGSKIRDYIILDAPGHIEFLKNMVTGASRAEAGLLVIDANEGIKENSKRHGHMISLLGIKQVTVLVNKMDLVDYNQEVFENIKDEFTQFLNEVTIDPISFIPISAMSGDNITTPSSKTPWYKGETVLSQVDKFKKAKIKEELPFRMPVQDIYKFTDSGDDRRIIAGTIESGTIKKGDDVLFLPSGKKSKLVTIEGFNIGETKRVEAQQAVGFTMETQIYIRPGELMVKAHDVQPKVASRFKANIFWVGKAPMVIGKDYKLKIGSTRTAVKLVSVLSVLDASDLSSDSTKNQIDKHDVAEAIFETSKPIAFDLAGETETSGRFVIVDNYEISGGGIILEIDNSGESYLKNKILERENLWEKGPISSLERSSYYRHKSKFIVFTGDVLEYKKKLAHELERELFYKNYKVYYLGLGNISTDLDDYEQIKRLGELARIMTDSGQIFITTLPVVDDYDLEKLALLNKPNDLIVVNVGYNNFTEYKVNLDLGNNLDITDGVNKIVSLLKEEEIILDFSI